jgi:hypothetical protein
MYIPELPARSLWQAVLLTWDSYNGLDIFKYWIANKAEVGKRDDMSMTDSDVDTSGVTLDFTSHPALPGVPVVFGSVRRRLAVSAELDDVGLLTGHR